ncbi:DUF2334 domain-containing protein [Paenibacillus sp. N3.4]|uniref:DUF2334 domain-containing protein n=1 Tax=Paenibacillus sp. N3.4 TaxID=2603222 RepID=UPI0011C782AA|nr:DUF2334 domain-containing protein [Paenibacillus sp. N3.4]TXK76946.1 DUF2334 domain-containing protein [Paenibacillus sp. N3.4]
MRISLYKQIWFRYVIAGMVSLCLFISLTRMITVEGADNNPRFIMMRLEDIGPGGYYSTLEGIGKLRATLEYLHQQHVQFSLAVIPRWKNVMTDGTLYDRSIDQIDEPYIQAFNKVLQNAAQMSGTVGMHGYTHQVGDERREDGQQASGIGNEFNIADRPETTTTTFAQNRLEEGYKKFRIAGLTPHFWEAPHYHTNPEQDNVFRSYFGLLYQPNTALNPNPTTAQYENIVNKGYGHSSLGNVFVPTTLSYIPNGKDEKFILNQIGKIERIHSFFYHPFLEFNYLSPVVDEMGNALIRDGIPEYTYPAENKSILQKLIAQMRVKNMPFYSIHDYVPFTPAERITVGTSKSVLVQIGNVTGRGQSDIVKWDKKNATMSVIQGQYRELRNEVQPVPKVWASIPYAEGSAFTLNSMDDSNKQGLWIVRPNGKLESYTSNGSDFVKKQSWKIPNSRWYDLYELRQPNGDCVLAGQSQDQSQLQGLYLHNGTVSPIKPYTFRSTSSRDLIVRDLHNNQGQSLFLFKNDTSQGVNLNWIRQTCSGN